MRYLVFALFFTIALASPNFAISKEVDIAVNSDRVLLNNIPIPISPHLSDFTAVLGAPSRVSRLVNNIYIYDDFGLLLYETPETKSITEITICFSNADKSFWANKPFSGNFSIKNRKLQFDQSIGDLMRLLHGVQFKNVAGLNWYVICFGIFEIDLRYNQERDSIIKASIAFK